jgi:hypothetical protein
MPPRKKRKTTNTSKEPPTSTTPATLPPILIKILKDFDNRKMEWVESLNTESVFATDAWLETIDWRSYTRKEGPTVAEHLRELSRQGRPPDPDDGDYLPASETKTAHNLVLETNRGTIIDYLDHFETMISSHILHRNLVSLEHRSKKEYERNLRPWTIQRDIDFSENGSIENFDKVQSEHWQTKHYTLFISVFCFLMVDEWNKEDGVLRVGDEVTVEGEIYIIGNQQPTVNMNSYWAVVKSEVN